MNQSLVPRTASIGVTGRASNAVKVVVIVIVINNEPPEVTTPNITFLYTQGQPPVPISHGVVLSDADSMFFQEVSLTLTITNAFNSLTKSDIFPIVVHRSKEERSGYTGSLGICYV